MLAKDKIHLPKALSNFIVTFVRVSSNKNYPTKKKVTSTNATNLIFIVNFFGRLLLLKLENKAALRENLQNGGLNFHQRWYTRMSAGKLPRKSVILPSDVVQFSFQLGFRRRVIPLQNLPFAIPSNSLTVRAI